MKQSCGNPCWFIRDWHCLYWLLCFACPGASWKLQSAMQFWACHMYNLTHTLIQLRRGKIQSTLTSKTLTLWRSVHLHQHLMNLLLAWGNTRVHGAVGESSIWLQSLLQQALESDWRLMCTHGYQPSCSWTWQWVILYMLMRLQSMVSCCKISDTSTSDAVSSAQDTAFSLFDHQRSWGPSLSKVQGPASNTRVAEVHDSESFLCCSFKGVFEAQGGKYLARLTLHGKPKHLGTYLDAEEAAKAVDAANIFLVPTMHALYTKCHSR